MKIAEKREANKVAHETREHGAAAPDPSDDPDTDEMPAITTETDPS